MTGGTQTKLSQGTWSGNKITVTASAGYNSSALTTTVDATARYNQGVTDGEAAVKNNPAGYGISTSTNHTGTYTLSSTGKTDLGASHSYRYIQTSGLYKDAGTVTYTSNGIKSVAGYYAVNINVPATSFSYGTYGSKTSPLNTTYVTNDHIRQYSITSGHYNSIWVNTSDDCQKSYIHGQKFGRNNYHYSTFTVDMSTSMDSTGTHSGPKNFSRVVGNIGANRSKVICGISNCSVRLYEANGNAGNWVGTQNISASYDSNSGNITASISWPQGDIRIYANSANYKVSVVAAWSENEE